MTIFLSLVGTLLQLGLSYGTTNIRWLQRHKLLSYSTNTAYIIDHGSVMYLILQILLFFNIRDDNNITGINNVALYDVVTITTTLYESNTTYKILLCDNIIDCIALKTIATTTIATTAGISTIFISLINALLHIIDQCGVFESSTNTFL